MAEKRMTKRNDLGWALRRFRRGVATYSEQDELGRSVLKLAGRAFTLAGLPEYLREELVAAAVFRIFRELWRYNPSRTQPETWIMNVAANWYRTERHQAKMRARRLALAAETLAAEFQYPDEVEFWDAPMSEAAEAGDQAIQLELGLGGAEQHG